MTKSTLKGIVAILVMIIGIYMISTNSWPTPPFISGIGFLLAGFGLWIPYCPIVDKICKD